MHTELENIKWAQRCVRTKKAQSLPFLVYFLVQQLRQTFGVCLMDFNCLQNLRETSSFVKYTTLCAPLTFFTRKFLLTYPEKKGKEERENEGKFEREEVENLNWKGKRYENEHRTFFFFFFFSLFPCHFLKPLKFVWGLPKWTIFTVKNHISHWEKIIFVPSEKYSSYAPGRSFIISVYTF